MWKIYSLKNLNMNRRNKVRQKETAKHSNTDNNSRIKVKRIQQNVYTSE